MKNIMQQSYSNLLNEEYEKNKSKPQKGAGWVENKMAKDTFSQSNTPDPIKDPAGYAGWQYAERARRLKNNPLQVEYEDELQKNKNEKMVGMTRNPKYKFL